MIENISAALSIVANIDVLLALAGGVLIGTIVGAIPGMTVVMGVALVLPFTFTMQPVVGILLLLGVYKGGFFGGSITAIVTKTPGTPAASCTILDGWPLAEKGQARKALDMALYASCVADFISNLSLILVAGWLAQFALQFGPAEFFTLIVFSLTIVAGVSGDYLSRGLVAAVLGLMTATIGLDLVYGTDRFVYGVVDLMGGLNFIPVLIGLFAIPEIIKHFTERRLETVEKKGTSGDPATFADFRRCFKTIIRGSFIGVILGAIPGIGGVPAAFLSYGEAKRTSKTPDNFGKGELEGIAAAESGNNGTAGSTMIPLLALGIPGDIITAVILGAFMIHGLRPGPIMFQQNLDLIMAIFLAIMLSSVFLFIIGKLSIRLFSRIAEIPNTILRPMVLVLCVFGAYSINNTTFDVLVMMVMGAVGYLMMQLRIPPAPFLIAFILGPLLEDSFRQSMLLSQGSIGIFFSSAISWIFWALALMSVIIIVRRNNLFQKNTANV